MASLPVMYALYVFAMSSCVSEAKYEVSHRCRIYVIPFQLYLDFTLVPKRNIKTSPLNPLRSSSQHVKEGHSITLLCSVNWVSNPAVYWYRLKPRNYYVAYVRYHKGLCEGRVENKSLVKLHVGNTSCINTSYELRIRDIDQQYEGGWYCLVDNKWQSDYIDFKVDIPDEAGTEYTTERTVNEPGSGNTLVPLIGGAAGGGIVLLVLVITGCAVYRSKRGSNLPDDGQASTYHNRQPGNAEAVVMEANPWYIISSPENDDYVQIDCRESASPSHEKGDARMVNHRPDPDDRNQSQAGLNCEDVYAVPDKSKKSATEDVEDVYSQVQKPKK